MAMLFIRAGFLVLRCVDSWASGYANLGFILKLLSLRMDGVFKASVFPSSWCELEVSAQNDDPAKDDDKISFTIHNYSFI